MKNYSFVLVPLAFTLLVAGCASEKVVTVRTVPDQADLTIDGQGAGQAPLVNRPMRFSSDKPNYEVLAKKEGYKPASAVVSYEPKKQKEYMLRLEKITSKMVSITSSPSDAEVLLNGVSSGRTPYKAELNFEKVSEYKVALKKAGFEDGLLTITLEPLSQEAYQADLKKVEEVSVPLVTFEPVSTVEGVQLKKISRPTRAFLEIIERSPNVKSVTRVSNNQESNAQIGGPVLSPTDDIFIYHEILEEKGQQDYSNIWRQEVGSYAKTRVTFGQSLDLNPNFSPDGKFVFFGSNRTSKQPGLWKVHLDGGGGITKLSMTSAADTEPDIGEQGQLIAYSSLPPTALKMQIWTMNAIGTLPTQLREGRSPRISADGKRLLFVRDNEYGNSQIWVMNIDGSGETQLTQNTEDYSTANPVWSPNGKWIAFSSDQGLDTKGRHNYDIWLMDSNGANITQLTTNGSQDDYPAWSRDGKFIYFRSNRGGVWNIWRFEPLGIDASK